MGSVKVALLSMMALDVWFEHFSEMLFISLQVFFRSVMFLKKFSKTRLFTSC